MSKILSRDEKFWLSILFAAACFLSPKSVSAVLCSKIFGVENSLKSSLTSAQRSWAPSGFTDPSRHDPKDFKYIVHGTGARDVMSLVEAINGIEAPFTHTHYILSASVISASKTVTHADIGFILEVPEKIIFGSLTNYDKLPNGVNNRLVPDPIETMNLFFSRHGLRTPEQVIKDTKSDDLNEIAIMIEGLPYKASKGRPEIIYPKVRGVFYRSTTNDQGKAIAEEFAKTIGLPLIDIP